MLTELSEAQDIEHELMMKISDFHCIECNEYFLSEDARVEREPHGAYTVICPHCGSSEIES